MNLKKNVFGLMILILVMLSMAVLITGCSVTHSIKTKSTQLLAEDLKSISKSIKEVKFTFTRPDVSIKLNMTEEPSEEMLGLMLSKVKAFTTVDHINEIANSVKWKLEVSEVHFTINSDKNDQTIEHAYVARYFKSYDASDHSIENIDAYRTWIKEGDR